ncbi:hypothetical protein QF001_003657 [Paraburkholderia youngii]|uniref:hypothetical protein n=1 Tax=Paraburkholderia youngii TaxID=2782701 RepID=UPI003D21EE24
MALVHSSTMIATSLRARPAPGQVCTPLPKVQSVVRLRLKSIVDYGTQQIFAGPFAAFAHPALKLS